MKGFGPGYTAWALVAFFFLFLGPPAFGALTVGEVSGELICQCGCTMVVANCVCSTADQLRATIAEKIKSGQTKEQIIAFFVAQYGEKMLAAPTKKGFNLTAWVIPFLALGAGGAVVYFAVTAWAIPQRRREEELKAGQEPALVSEKYRHQLEKDLKEFD